MVNRKKKNDSVNYKHFSVCTLCKSSKNATHNKTYTSSKIPRCVLLPPPPKKKKEEKKK